MKISRLMTNLSLIVVAISISLASYAGEWTVDQIIAYTKCSGYETCDSYFKREKSSIEAYQTSPIINDELRYGTITDHHSEILKIHLDNALTKKTFPNNLILFRGISSLFYRDDVIYVKGEEFIDLGYTSTAITFKRAKVFAGAGLFILYHESAFNGIWMGIRENELLLPRGLRFKVMESKMSKDKFVQIVQVCNLACGTKVPNDAFKLFNEIKLH
jgi:hypothetical protein